MAREFRPSPTWTIASDMAEGLIQNRDMVLCKLSVTVGGDGFEPTASSV
jgi:hypothetical protein